MRRISTIVAVILVLSFVCALVVGCGGPTVVVKRQPPPLRTEVRPVKPFPNAVWISGHWEWNRARNDYVWVSGHWVKARPGRTWVAGHWKKVPGGWAWVKGYWR